MDLAKLEASQYGEAKSKSVIGKLMGKFPEFRSSSKDIMLVIEEVINEVNSMDSLELEGFLPKKVKKQPGKILIISIQTTKIQPTKNHYTPFQKKKIYIQMFMYKL